MDKKIIPYNVKYYNIFKMIFEYIVIFLFGEKYTKMS